MGDSTWTDDGRHKLPHAQSSANFEYRSVFNQSMSFFWEKGIMSIKTHFLWGFLAEQS